jgi:hypothetical protein
MTVTRSCASSVVAARISWTLAQELFDGLAESVPKGRHPAALFDLMCDRAADNLVASTESG